MPEGRRRVYVCDGKEYEHCLSGQAGKSLTNIDAHFTIKHNTEKCLCDQYIY